MNNKTSTVAAALLLLCGCEAEPEVVYVEDTETPDEEADEDISEVASWDVNGDDRIQSIEYLAWAHRGVAGWDRTGDGLLDEAEFRAGWTEAGWTQPEVIFAAWDKNRDATLTEDEFFTEDAWREWDADEDGELSEREFEYY